jgi:signal transduction histidine kinase/CheY-like chemotaxis protein
MIVWTSWAGIPRINYIALNRDSLRRIFHNKGNADTTRLNTLYALARSYDFVNPDSLILYARILHTESEKLESKEGIARSFQLEGFYYTLLDKHKDALSCYMTELKYGEESGDIDYIGDACASIGMTYAQMNSLDKSIIYQQRCLQLAKKFNNPSRLISVMGNLSYTYFHAGNLRKAIDLNLEIIRMIDSLPEKEQFMVDRAGPLCNLAQMQKKTGDVRNSLKNFLEAYELNKRSGNSEYLGACLEGLGNLFAEDSLNMLGPLIGDNRPSHEIGLGFLKEYQEKARQERDTASMAGSLLTLGKFYIRLKDYNAALKYLSEGWRFRSYIMHLELLLDYTKGFSMVYENLGDYSKAFSFASLRIKFSDSLERVKMAEKVSLLTESFEIEQMEGQLSQKEQQLKNNRYITYLFIAISALILILAFIVLYFLRQKQKAAKLLEHQNHEIEKARNRAEQGEKFKERFLASMSHEIRTPLNAVIGITGLLLEEKQIPKTENYLKIIRQAGEHLTGIINDILDLSKIEAGKLELHKTPFSLHKLLEEMQNLFGARAKEKDLQLIIHEAEGVPDWVLGDIGRIRQVLLNLTGNAIKFTDRGIVQIKIMEGKAEGERRWVQFIVEDTGSGIPTEEQSFIFQEFIQVKSGEQKMAGTGLGLSISKKLVERMGGTITMESESGRGSVFSFSIPLEISSEFAFQAIQSAKEDSVAAIKGNFRILVVEDNLSNQIVTEGILERILPESVIIMTDSGNKSLELLGRDLFDLVLMDVRLPGMDGYETTKRLRELPNENARVPVIALTASVIMSDIQRCIDAGMNGYVPKPVSRGVLAKTIREHLRINESNILITENQRDISFLGDLTGKPSWVHNLFEICNGRQDRFFNYLKLFTAETGKELNKWETWKETGNSEMLALSLHKIIPHLKIFSGEAARTLAGKLESDLRTGWNPSYKSKLDEITTLIFNTILEAQKLINDFK